MPDYSSVVRALRIAVPGAGIFLLVLFFLWPAFTNIRLPHIDKALIKGDRTELINPRYESKDENGQRYVVTAARAIQVRATPDVLQLENPSAQLEKNDNTLGPQITAKAGTYQNKTSQLQLEDGVTLVTPQGDRFQTSAADVDLKNKTIDVKQPVAGGGPTLDLSGQGLTYDQDEGLLTVAGPAKLVLHDKDAKHETRLLLLLILLLPLAANAADPIAIEASGSLVWHQSDKTYHAIGDATATRGNMVVHADELIAHYTDAKGKNEIQALDAKGNVKITNGTSSASGPMAHYDMNTGDMVMAGQNLMLSSVKGDSLTAQQEIQFNDKTGAARALGKPVMTRLDRALHAEQIDGQFVKDASGNWALQTANATGGVVITAKDSVATGDRGFYDAAKNSALLTGNVKIAKGPNTMTGDRAEINTTTGEARLLPAETAAGAPKGRVKAILFQTK